MEPDQPVNTLVQVYYNPVKPDFAGDWQLRVQFGFLFPKLARLTHEHRHAMAHDMEQPESTQEWGVGRPALLDDSRSESDNESE